MGMASIERRVDAFGRYFSGSRAVMIIVAVNVAVFLICAAAEPLLRLSGGDPTLPERWLILPSPFAATLTRLWTWVTYMVTQTSLIHLLFNMLWLICAGGLLREMYTDRRIMLLYLAAGLSGGWFFEIGTPSGSWLIGSSAAVLGIITAAGVCMANRPVRLLLLGECRFKWVAFAMILLTFAGAGGSGASGAVWAHAGGVAAGLLFPLSDRLVNRVEKRGVRKEERRVASPSRQRAFKSGDVRRVAEAMEGRLSDPARLDELLDKIRISGYASLSKAEQLELEELSRRIKPHKNKNPK